MPFQEYVAEYPITKLTEHPDNPRRGNVGLIGESIETNGFYGTVIVQKSTGHIIVGNHRARAALNAGFEHLPVMLLDVDDEQATKIMLADNRTNDVAFYDDATLAELLSSLEGDLVGTGFTDHDLELLLAKVEHDAEPPPLPDEKEWIAPPERVKPGDIWQVGDCRFICADTMLPETHKMLLEGVPVNLAFTSPPYADRRRYDIGSEFRPIHPDNYVEWFKPVQERIAESLVEDGSWVVNLKTSATGGIDMETYVLDLILAHVREWGWHWGTEYCWERIGVPKSVVMRFKPAYEMLYCFVKGRWKFRPDNVRHYSERVPQYVEGTSFDWSVTQGVQSPFRTRENEPDLAYPSNRLPTFQGEYDTMIGHPASFPWGLAKFFTLAYTDPNDVVLDPFAGSGSTLIGASVVGRSAFGIEISPLYCDIILQRLEESTGAEGELLRRVSD